MSHEIALQKLQNENNNNFIIEWVSVSLMPNTNMCEMQNMHSSVCVWVCARGHLGVVNLQRSFVAIGQRLNTEQGNVCTSIASCKIPIDVTTKNITTTMLQHINTNNNKNNDNNDNMCYKKVTHRHTHSAQLMEQPEEERNDDNDDAFHVRLFTFWTEFACPMHARVARSSSHCTQQYITIIMQLDTINCCCCTVLTATDRTFTTLNMTFYKTFARIVGKFPTKSQLMNAPIFSRSNQLTEIYNDSVSTHRTVNRCQCNREPRQIAKTFWKCI